MADHSEGSYSGPIPLNLHRPIRAKTFVGRTRYLWGVLGTIATIAGSGWAGQAYVRAQQDKKADVKVLVKDEGDIATLKTDVKGLEVEVHAIAHELHETRNDIRAFVAGRPLPVLAPEPTPTKAP